MPESKKITRFALAGLCFVLIGITSAAFTQEARDTQNDPPTVRLQPQIRSESLAANNVAPLQRAAIEPFLAAPRVFEPENYQYLPRIVASVQARNLLTKGDLFYARSLSGQAFVMNSPLTDVWNIYRDPKPLKDPASDVLLGMEAQYIGRARLLRGEQVESVPSDKKTEEVIRPATLEIIEALSEIRPGDRLFSARNNQWRDLTPHPAPAQTSATIISVYGDGVTSAAQNQIVVINQGRAQGLEPGHVMSIRKAASLSVDKTDPQRPQMQGHAEWAGQALVFLTFDKLSYALVGAINQPVLVGDRLGGN